ncbi:tetratricopeptide repeat protein [Undibacterium sp. Ji50W]|uniref:tetratricopeptide repeat protein n=1 Tax=Undibacterium sp. Ji50W TaxID=3413041 RepID=UPI003BF33EE8
MTKLLIAMLLGSGIAVCAYAGVKEGTAAYRTNNFDVALKELRPAAQEGDAAAQNMLGAMYQYGKGVPQDYVQAVDWYKKAAMQGETVAQYNLGFMFKNGLGVKQDYMQAKDWYLKAATKGDPLAMNNLGSIMDLLNEPIQAMNWFRKSASLGNARAMFNIAGKFCGERENQQVQDLILCYSLRKLVATIEPVKKAIDARDKVAGKLSKPQIAEGDSLMLELQKEGNFLAALDLRLKKTVNSK